MAGKSSMMSDQNVPMESSYDHDDVLQQAAAWKKARHGVALATVVTTWGSSPRPVGSQLAIKDDGAFIGSVSGGCIEGAVVSEALAAIKDGETRLLDFGVTDEMAWEVGLSCGGKVEVFVEPVQ
ncbi:MAG: xanthine/CO dehydrogenase XdhC/CoxF family maturation factor [Alphaproteobacteria bacterium]|jgi:xanthine/CO dehydrogenase XdhC/CoxF family maturation factor